VKTICPPHLWDTLEQIRHTLNLDHFQFADLLTLTEKEYWALRKKRREPSISSTVELTKRLNIGFDTLVLNQFDYQTLEKHFYGEVDHLPEKYRIGAFSKRRAVAPYLNFVQDHFGRENRSLLLREFQLTNSAFLDPNAPINLRFAIDLGNYILKYQSDPALLIEMGKYSVSSHKNTLISELLAQESTLSLVFEKMATEITPKMIESNYHWKIESETPQTLLLKGTPTLDLQSYHPKEYVFSRVACLFRTGVISAIPTYLDFPFFPVKKTACVSQGDPHCLFEVHFHRSKRIS
jgi:hypothetical protein